MADVKWIKITTDMFDNRKIRHLRRLPEGNNIVLIWVMLLTMAGRCNSNGMVFLTENIPYTPKMLADELDFEENTVQLALSALERLNMVVTDSGFFTIAGWDEYQNIEGMDKIREQNRLRKQRQRDKQKALPDGSHVTSRDSHATDIEEDKDIDKEKENKSNGRNARFTPPSLNEVKEYCKERGNKVDADKWFDYYTSNGWKVGKNSMKDWKAAVRTWERSEKDRSGKHEITGDTRQSKQYGVCL